MEHPERARVVVTWDDEDGASDYFEHTVDAVVRIGRRWQTSVQGQPSLGTGDGIGAVGPGTQSEPVINPWFPGPGGVRFNLFTFLPASDGAGEIAPYRGTEPDEGQVDCDVRTRRVV